VKGIMKKIHVLSYHGAVAILSAALGQIAIAQFAPPVEQAPKRIVPAAPVTGPQSGGTVRPAPPAQSGAPAPSPAVGPTVAEVVHKGRRVRAVHDAARTTLTVEVDGKTIGRVNNISQMKKPALVTGSDVSLVSIWTMSSKQECASYVLVSMPMEDGVGAPEMKSGFGGCNPLIRQLRLTRGTWEFWSLIAYREDSAKVGVAVTGNGKLLVTEQIAKPCLFAKSDAETTRCNDGYIATGLGSAERGIRSGEERIGTRRITTFQNRSRNTGSIEIDGLPYKAYSDVKMFHVEPSTAVADAALVTVWVQPEAEQCGYRVVLRIPAGGGEIGLHDRAGVCRPKSITHIHTRPDKTVAGWAKIMYRDGDPQVDIAAWSGGNIELTTVTATCFAAAPISRECLNQYVPSLARPAGSIGTVAAAGVPAGPSPTTGVAPAPRTGGQPTMKGPQNQTVIKGFLLLSVNQINPALAEFDRALIADPNDMWAYVGRGYGLAIKGNLDNAMPDLDRAIQINPRFAAAYGYRGFVFLLRNEPDRAIAQLDEALSIDPALWDSYAFRGGAYAAKGDTARALADLDKSLSMKPDNAMALGIRGRTHLARKDSQKALDDYTAALALAPNSVSLQIGRGYAFEALGKTAEALVAFKAALAEKPTSLTDIVAQGTVKQRVAELERAGTTASGNACPKNETCL
jgi:Tfp pilus assembly protein PilF